MQSTGSSGTGDVVLDLLRLSPFDLRWPPTVSWTYVGWKTFSQHSKDKSFAAWADLAQRTLLRHAERREGLPRKTLTADDVVCVWWYDPGVERMWCWGVRNTRRKEDEGR